MLFRSYTLSDHDPVFTVIVQVNGKEDASGTGRSKRAAEQSAAKSMLIREGIWNEDEATL